MIQDRIALNNEAFRTRKKMRRLSIDMKKERTINNFEVIEKEKMRRIKGKGRNSGER